MGAYDSNERVHTGWISKAFGDYGTKEGVNSETVNDFNKYRSSNDKDFKKHLDDKYKYGGFSDAEAKGFGALAATGTTASAIHFQHSMKMKEADHLRGQGKYTKSPGLHTGYGFGMGGSFKTSGMDDWKSFVRDTPYVANESIRNSMGFLTAQQKESYRMSNTFGKGMMALNPLASVYMIGSGMMELNDPGQIVADQMSQAAAFTGFVSGMRLGGAVSGAMGMGTIGRGAARILGGGVVGAAGYAAVQGINTAIRDITSAESEIGSEMYKISQRDTYADISQNQATLTARQRALQQINSSTLNDRGFTLGNEASILRNMA